MATQRPTFTRLTPNSTHTGGAVSLYQIAAPAAASDDDAGRMIDEAVAALGLSSHALPVGSVRLRRIAEADDVLACRVSRRVLHISTHAGRAVGTAVERALLDAGLVETAPGSHDPRTLYPESRSLAEACALDALSRATSPDAVGAVLRQVALWDSHLAGAQVQHARAATPVEAACLDRLLHPPTVAVIGPANIGKSTLLNAIARADLSIALDEPGTTLDHVGATLTLHDLTLHWLDTPGWTGGPLTPAQHEAMELARAAVRSADLVLNCGDAASGFIDPANMGTHVDQTVLRVGTRSDRGHADGADMRVAAIDGAGLDELTRTVSDLLVPPSLRHSSTIRWRFHPALPD